MNQKKSIEPYLNAQKMFEQYYNKWMTAFPNEKSLFTCYYMYDILGLLAAVSKCGSSLIRSKKNYSRLYACIKGIYAGKRSNFRYENLYFECFNQHSFVCMGISLCLLFKKTID